jgi:hypothetical protein
MKAHSFVLWTAPLLLALAAACEETQESPLAESNSSAGSTIETFRIQARIFCPNSNLFCGHPDEESLVNSYYLAINEMNLEYIPTGYSFRAMAPIITHDDRFSTIDATSGNAGNGESNALLIAELTALAAQQPDRITLFLMPDLNKCWNGIPCPGSDDNFNGDDVIFCTPPSAGSEAGRGSVYAHEMGHYWCLRHTFSSSDPSSAGTLDYDYDDDVCDTLSNVHDTPADPGTYESSDDGNWHEWCETTVLDADPVSPHDTRCAVQCYQRINGTPVETNYSPMVRNAMSYYGFSCRGPYLHNYTRYEAFTAGQVAQIQECRVAVPVRLLLNDACVDDTDHDGVCDSIDRCPNLLDARNDDEDGDGFASPCDRCPLDPNGHTNNWDGDRFCDETDMCPNDVDETDTDTDGDGIWDTCDTCPSDPDPTNLDTDDDGNGDVCDSDDDNDGCSDRTDHHPKSNSVPVGMQINANCQPSSSVRHGVESGDTDGDGLRDCRDYDDDNDGILDENDSCPRTSSTICLYNGQSCPLNPIFFTCRGGACNQQLLRVMERVNPDPTRTLFYEIESVRDDVLRVTPLQGRSIADSISGMRGTLRLNAAGTRMRGALQMDIVDTRGRVLAELATYDGASVNTIGTTGTRLEITVPNVNSAMLVRGVQ